MDGVVLAVDRQEVALRRLHGSRHKLARHYESLFVCESDSLTRIDGSERWYETDRTDCCRDDEVAFRMCCRGNQSRSSVSDLELRELSAQRRSVRLARDAHEARPKLSDLFLDHVDSASRGKRDDAKAIRESL